MTLLLITTCKLQMHVQSFAFLHIFTASPVPCPMLVSQVDHALLTLPHGPSKGLEGPPHPTRSSRRLYLLHRSGWHTSATPKCCAGGGLSHGSLSIAGPKGDHHHIWPIKNWHRIERVNHLPNYILVSSCIQRKWRKCLSMKSNWIELKTWKSSGAGNVQHCAAVTSTRTL